MLCLGRFPVFGPRLMDYFQICFPRPTVPLSMTFACVTEKWATSPSIYSDANGAGTWADQGQILEIGRPCPLDGPTFPRKYMPPLSAIVEQMVRPTEPRSSIPISELPPLVLEPNRRKVESEEEVDEPTSPLLATSQKLAKTIRSLSLKRG